MTHGTVDVGNILNARAFYEEVLGLRSVLRSEMAQFTSGGGDFTFVGVQVGEHVADQSADNRWVVLLDGEDKLEERHRRALALKDQLGIRSVTEPVRNGDGSLSFMVENGDSNWFELSTRSRRTYADVFFPTPGGVIKPLSRPSDSEDYGRGTY